MIMSTGFRTRVHGYGQFSTAPSWMPDAAAARNVFDHILAHLRRERGQFAVFKLFKVSRELTLSSTG
jgi:hypothetical protein